MKRKFLAIIIGIMIINTTVFSFQESLFVYAEEKNITETKEELDDVLTNLKSMENEMKKLQDEIKNIQDNITNIEGRKVFLEKESEIIKEEIKVIQADKKEKYEILNSIIKIKYEQQSMGYLGLILEAKSFNNFLTRLEVISQLIKNNNAIVDEVRQLEKDLVEKNEKLESNIKEVESQKLLVEKEQKKLEELIKEKDSELTKLLELRSKLETEIQVIQAELAASATGGEYKGGKMAWPVIGHYSISSFFGGRIDPISGVESYHKGMDIPAPEGALVIAAASGTVVRSEYNPSYGNLVVIDHGGGILSYYAHNSKLIAKVGQSVAKGETIAEVGTTGYSTGNHLHFEVQVNGTFVDPLDYLR